MASADDHHAQKLEGSLHDMISGLTNHLTGLSKDGRAMGIITLAGSNKGAVMKADLLDGATEINKAKVGEDDGKVSAYTNSNFQAVNNSIMMDGECTAEDPGVHIEIVDCIDVDEGDEDGDENDRLKSKGKKEEMKKKKGKKESLHEEKHLEGKEGKGSEE